MKRAPEAAGVVGVDLLAVLPMRIGQIVVERISTGEFDLRHREDAGRRELTESRSAEAALEIARFDEQGKFRPLKTAPNLRHGWRLLLREAGEVRLALDYFYPGRLAALRAEARGELPVTSFRETLERQTGMYRAAAALTSGQAEELVARFCRSHDGCLRTIRWPYDAGGSPASRLLPAEKFDPAFDQTGRDEPTVPLLCQEACNLLVAAARAAVKSEAAS